MFYLRYILLYASSSRVSIYVIGEVSDMDSIHEKLGKLREQAKSIRLEYDSAKKKWSVYDFANKD